MQAYWPIIMRGLLALAAVLLWVNVQAFSTQPITLQATIIPQNLASGLGIDQILPPVEVTLAAPALRGTQVDPDNIQFGFNARSISSGTTRTVDLYPINLPDDFRILRFAPSNIPVSASPATTKLVSVSPIVSAFPPDGFVVQSVVPNPSQVELIGSPAALGLIDTVWAEVDLAGARATITKPSVLVVRDANQSTISTITTAPGVVSITATIQPGANSRSLGIRPIFSGEVPSGYFVREVRFNPPVVTITGTAEVLATLDQLLSTPINLTDHRQDFSERVGLELPRNSQLAGDPLIEAQVIIELAESSREFSLSPQFINLADGFSVSVVSPSQVRVVLTGDQATLSQLSRNDIKLNIDLSQSLSGSATVTIVPGMFEVPTSVRVGSFTPEVVDVILTRSP